MNLAIIGCGAIGIRHFQSAMDARFINRIAVCDTSHTQIYKAQEMYKGNPERITFTTSIDKLRDYDTAIIATSAGPRKDAFMKLVSNNNIKNIIFEKFLFNSEDDYIDVNRVIKSYCMNSFVNTPRRAMPGYKELRENTIKADHVNICVTGYDWNLGSNSVHFLDLYEYLTGDTDYDIEIEIKKVVDSKRKGYNDFTGMVTVEGKHSMILATNRMQKDKPAFINVDTDDYFFEIIEGAGMVHVTHKVTGEVQDGSFDFRLQSQLTKGLLYDINNNGTCALPTYSESMATHLRYLKALKKSGFSGLIT
jgi:hypothetical protein